MGRAADIAARETGKAQKVALEFQTGSHGPFKAVRTISLTDPYGYYKVTQSFSQSGTLRASWRDSGGQTMYSRNVSVTVH